jgi:hypothetical protein
MRQQEGHNTFFPFNFFYFYLFFFFNNFKHT